MNRSRISPPLFALLGTGLMLLSGTQAMAADEAFGGLAPHKGRETVFGICTQCHSTAIILQNHLTRERWDTTITWMQEKQGLHYLPPDTRNEILDYLAATQGVTATTSAAAAAPAATAAKEKAAESKPAKSGMYQYDYPPNPIWDWKK